MARKILIEKLITNAEAKGVLEGVKEEELGEFQRRTLDYSWIGMTRFRLLTRCLRV